MSLALLRRSSLHHQAMLLGMAAATTLSKQGLHKRLKQPALAFLQHCLEDAISCHLRRPDLPALPAFQRVLVQDSTCLSLPPTLARAFPGPANQSGKAQASLRIQCVYDLCAERFVHFLLCAFTRNDQSASSDILPLLRSGDLLLRDLAYFTLHSLRDIAAKGAVFLTRLRFGTSVLDPGTAQPLPWRSILSSTRPVDLSVLLGMEDKIPVRLIAIPLPQAVANERRRKARLNRDRRVQLSELYFYLLGWGLFLTNASPQQMPIQKVPAIYRLRWRIEILFRSWKSHLGLQTPHRIGLFQAQVLINGLLLFAVLIHYSIPERTHIANPPPSEPLSLLRVADFLALFFLHAFFAEKSACDFSLLLHQQLDAHGRYDKRRRKHYEAFKWDALS